MLVQKQQRKEVQQTEEAKWVDIFTQPHSTIVMTPSIRSCGTHRTAITKAHEKEIEILIDFVTKITVLPASSVHFVIKLQTASIHNLKKFCT